MKVYELSERISYGSAELSTETSVCTRENRGKNILLEKDKVPSYPAPINATD